MLDDMRICFPACLQDVWSEKKRYIAWHKRNDFTLFLFSLLIPI
jgi:hypothetical protein